MATEDEQHEESDGSHVVEEIEFIEVDMESEYSQLREEHTVPTVPMQTDSGTPTNNIPPQLEEEEEVNDILIMGIESEVRSLERALQKEISVNMGHSETCYKLNLREVAKQRAMYKGSENPEHQFQNPSRKYTWTKELE